MKTQSIKSYLLAIVFFIPFLTNAQLQKAEFQASGLTCSMCSNAINKALKTVPFIESVDVNLNKNLFILSFKKDVPVDIDVIKKKVEDAGFSIAKFWITVNLSNEQIQNDAHVSVSGMNFHFMNVKPQTLNGIERLQLIDKNYISAKEFKKFSTYTSMSCYQTGTMGNCCKSKDDAVASGSRIYHVTI
ncbi:MAG: heavy-metal-associated domain-containing protein [Bacteroidetes bacterium]|nr:heavy-metal-associated domain-containing protein [Bacteroidota bacterium]